MRPGKIAIMSEQIVFKDVLGPLISVLAAALSVLCFRLNFRLSKRMADRSLNLEAQKLLLEFNRQLISDPWLWSIYDDHPVRKDPEFQTKCGNSALFHGKLLALAYLVLNMFEIVLIEVPEPDQDNPRDISNVWVNFFHYTMARSSVVRGILEGESTARLYNPVLVHLYREWKKSTGEVNQSSAKIPSTHQQIQ